MQTTTDHRTAMPTPPTHKQPQANRAAIKRPRIAVVGSGISGLTVAHTLREAADVTLFEAGGYFGGHTNTVDVTLPDASGKPVTCGVDTGFLVFNDRTYPNLINLFAELGVHTSNSEMSFSVQVRQAGLEWSGNSLSTVFAQRKNMFKPAFLRMLWDLLRFNRATTRLAQQGSEAQHQETLGAFLNRGGYSRPFIDWYLLPMIGCIWSCPTDQMLQFPVATLIRFCHNHGLIAVTNRPQWKTVTGGARNYVEKIIAHQIDARLNAPVQLIERAEDGVRVVSKGKVEHFDEVVLATHSDQALALLRDPTDAERQVLGAIRYQANTAVLHTDASVLPADRKVWAAWNYERGSSDAGESARVCLHYWLNVLQPLPFKDAVVVSLNPVSAIDRKHVMAEFEYAHPVFDMAAMAAQRALPGIQGQQNTWFCGAWAGYGFHEDGHKSGLAVARELLTRIYVSDHPTAEFSHD